MREEPGPKNVTPAHRMDATFRPIVDIIETALGADKCKFAVAEDDVLIPVCVSGDDTPNADNTHSITESLLGQVYSAETPCLIDDLQNERGTASTTEAADRPTYRSFLSVPVGATGVLVAAASEPGAFTETDQELVERLIETVELDSELSVDRSAEVASILSHDLQGPLQLARGHLELAEATGNPEHYEKIGAALDRIEALADDLVMLLRTEERIGDLETVELEHAVRRAWTTVATPKATLNVREDMSIAADRSTFQQLLENLFRNAIDHAGDAVTVAVGVHETGFYVEDDGPGIPPDHRDAVFEWQCSTAGRSGLGLSIVQRIVSAHGWRIDIREGTLGGARFEIHTNSPGQPD